MTMIRLTAFVVFAMLSLTLLTTICHCAETQKGSQGLGEKVAGDDSKTEQIQTSRSVETTDEAPSLEEPCQYDPNDPLLCDEKNAMGGVKVHFFARQHPRFYDPSVFQVQPTVGHYLPFSFSPDVHPVLRPLLLRPITYIPKHYAWHRRGSIKICFEAHATYQSYDASSIHYSQFLLSVGGAEFESNVFSVKMPQDVVNCIPKHSDPRSLANALTMTTNVVRTRACWYNMTNMTIDTEVSDSEYDERAHGCGFLDTLAVPLSDLGSEYDGVPIDFIRTDLDNMPVIQMTVQLSHPGSWIYASFSVEFEDGSIAMPHGTMLRALPEQSDITVLMARDPALWWDDVSTGMQASESQRVKLWIVQLLFGDKHSVECKIYERDQWEAKISAPCTSTHPAIGSFEASSWADLQAPSRDDMLPTMTQVDLERIQMVASQPNDCISSGRPSRSSQNIHRNGADGSDHPSEANSYVSRNVCSRTIETVLGRVSVHISNFWRSQSPRLEFVRNHGETGKVARDGFLWLRIDVLPYPDVDEIDIDIKGRFITLFQNGNEVQTFAQTGTKDELTKHLTKHCTLWIEVSIDCKVTDSTTADKSGRCVLEPESDLLVSRFDVVAIIRRRNIPSYLSYSLRKAVSLHEWHVIGTSSLKIRVDTRSTNGEPGRTHTQHMPWRAWYRSWSHSGNGHASELRVGSEYSDLNLLKDWLDRKDDCQLYEDLFTRSKSDSNGIWYEEQVIPLAVLVTSDRSHSTSSESGPESYSSQLHGNNMQHEALESCFAARHLEMMMGTTGKSHMQVDPSLFLTVPQVHAVCSNDGGTKVLFTSMVPGEPITVREVINQAMLRRNLEGHDDANHDNRDTILDVAGHVAKFVSGIDAIGAVLVNFTMDNFVVDKKSLLVGLASSALRDLNFQGVHFPTPNECLYCTTSSQCPNWSTMGVEIKTTNAGTAPSPYSSASVPASLGFCDGVCCVGPGRRRMRRRMRDQGQYSTHAAAMAIELLDPLAVELSCPALHTMLAKELRSTPDFSMAALEDEIANLRATGICGRHGDRHDNRHGDAGDSDGLGPQQGSTISRYPASVPWRPVRRLFVIVPLYQWAHNMITFIDRLAKLLSPEALNNATLEYRWTARLVVGDCGSTDMDWDLMRKKHPSFPIDVVQNGRPFKCALSTQRASEYIRDVRGAQAHDVIMISDADTAWPPLMLHRIEESAKCGVSYWWPLFGFETVNGTIAGDDHEHLAGGSMALCVEDLFQSTMWDGQVLHKMEWGYQDTQMSNALQDIVKGIRNLETSMKSVYHKRSGDGVNQDWYGSREKIAWKE